MKPLLPAPLTYLDRYISDRLVWRKRGLIEWDADRLQTVSVFADRRDAALMWWAQRHPEHCEVIPASTDPTDPYRVHVRAWIAPPEIESEGEWPA